ncbi:MAG TPA: FG-GAP-like repeat-containing protein [Pyrinomonadaceae bacterium]|nr:FG-GAP-like repeat-containing protein [Pyrinomonadaceae bacterium]
MNVCQLLFSVVFCLLATINIIAQPGSLDPTFGSGGKVIGDLTGAGTDFFQTRFNDIAIQADGKIVVAGTVDRKFAVFRYNPNGTPDIGFGTNGRVVIDIYPGLISGAGAVAIQPDGKIIAGGYTGAPNGSLVNQSDFAIMRFNQDGSRDLSFGSGNGGIAFSGSAIDNVKDIVLQPDGKILITGDLLSRFGSMVYKGTSIFAMRFHANGSADTAFGTNGTAALSFELSPNPPIVGSQTAESLALQPDGKIVVVGTASVLAPTGSYTSGAAIARFLPNGQPDNSFDEDGKSFTQLSSSQTPINYEIKSVALQPDGRIVVAGAVGGDFAVFRYTTAGALDPSFDGDGTLIASIETGSDFARDILIQRNGKIVVVGESAVGANKNFAVARFTVNGSFDTSFDGDGKAITDFGSNATDSISRALLQPDGRILAVGISNVSSGSTTIFNIALARYIGDTPTSPFDFDGDRRADISVFRQANGNWYILPSQTNAFYGFPFGQSGDQIAPADYDGDGKTDVAVFRDSVTGAGNFAYFYILNSSDGSFRAEQFGATRDVQMAGDWDGDGKADLAVYRAATTLGGQSFFYYRPSSQPTVNFNTIPLGTAGDKPLLGDFDGDGRLDPAVFRPSTGTWIILQSSINQITQTNFGLSTDIAVPADYDGDGRANIAVFRPSNGTWYTSQSSANNYGAIVFGANGDVPVPADYDGDGRADAAVFRPSNGAWYLNRTTSGLTGVSFGASGDKPASNAFIR